MNGFKFFYLPTIICCTSIAWLLITGCSSSKPAPISTGSSAAPAKVKLATDIDVATTQPMYWFDKPGIVEIQYSSFQPLWDACDQVARSYQFDIDRQDFRLGLLTTKPMISKEILEPWRRDAGDFHAVLADSVSTMSRTVRFSIVKSGEGKFIATPKVMVQRMTLLERRITSTAQYRTAFSGPSSVQREDQTNSEIPASYWSPIGRDYELEKHLAEEIKNRLSRK